MLPTIMQLTNSKNIHLYFVFNLLTILFLAHQPLKDMVNSYCSQNRVFYIHNLLSLSIFSLNKILFSLHHPSNQLLLLYFLSLSIYVLWLSKPYLYLHLLAIKSLFYFHKQHSKFIINNQFTSFISKHIYIKILFSSFFLIRKTILPSLEASPLYLS